MRREVTTDSEELFQSLLNKLGSDTAKENAILHAVEQGAVAREQWVQLAIHHYAEDQQYDRARRIALKHDLPSRATELLEKEAAYLVQQWDILHAVELLGENGHPEKAIALAEQHLRKVPSSSLATYYAAAKRTREAINHALDAHRYEYAAQLALDSDDERLKIDTYVKVSNEVEQASSETLALLAEQLGRLDKAILHYTRAGQYNKAGELAERTGKIDAARSNYLRSGNLSSLVRISDPQSLSLLIEGYERSGKAIEAARVLKAQGKVEEAKAAYERGIAVKEPQMQIRDLEKIAREFGDTERAETYKAFNSFW